MGMFFRLIRRGRSTGRGLLLALLLGVLLTGIAGLAVAPAFLRHRGDWPFERAFAEVAKEAAIPRSASDLKPPGPLSDRRLLAYLLTFPPRPERGRPEA